MKCNSTFTKTLISIILFVMGCETNLFSQVGYSVKKGDGTDATVASGITVYTGDSLSFDIDITETNIDDFTVDKEHLIQISFPTNSDKFILKTPTKTEGAGNNYSAAIAPSEDNKSFPFKLDGTFEDKDNDIDIDSLGLKFDTSLASGMYTMEIIHKIEVGKTQENVIIYNTLHTETVKFNYTKLDFKIEEILSDSNSLCYNSDDLSFRISHTAPSPITARIDWTETGVDASTTLKNNAPQNSSYNIAAKDFKRNKAYKIKVYFSNGFELTGLDGAQQLNESKHRLIKKIDDYILEPAVSVKLKGNNYLIGRDVAVDILSTKCNHIDGSKDTIFITHKGVTDTIKISPFGPSTDSLRKRLELYEGDIISVAIDTVKSLPVTVDNRFMAPNFSDIKILPTPLCERNEINLSYTVGNVLTKAIDSVKHYIETTPGNFELYSEKTESIPGTSFPVNGLLLLDSYESVTIKVWLKDRDVPIVKTLTIGNVNDGTADDIELNTSPEIFFKDGKNTLSISRQQSIINLYQILLDYNKTTDTFSYTLSNGNTSNDSTITPSEIGAGEHDITITRTNGICNTERKLKLEIIPSSVSLPAIYCYEEDTSNHLDTIKVGVKWLVDKYQDTVGDTITEAIFHDLKVTYNNAPHPLPFAGFEGDNNEYRLFEIYPSIIFNDVVRASGKELGQVDIEAEISMERNVYLVNKIVEYKFEDYLEATKGIFNPSKYTLRDNFDTLENKFKDYIYKHRIANYSAHEMIGDSVITSHFNNNYYDVEFKFKLSSRELILSEIIEVDPTPTSIVKRDASAFLILEKNPVCPTLEPLHLRLNKFRVSSVDTVTNSNAGEWFNYDPLDENWYFISDAAHKLSNTLVQVNYIYFDENLCPVEKSEPIRIDPSVADASGRLINFNSRYCLTETTSPAKMNTDYTIDSIQNIPTTYVFGPDSTLTTGQGFNYDNVNGVWEFNPHKADSLGSGENFFYVLHYKDKAGCPVSVRDSVRVISGLANTNGVTGLDSAYCFGDDSVQINALYKNILILKGPGVHSNGSEFYFNPGNDTAFDRTKDNIARVTYSYNDGDKCAWTTHEEIKIYRVPETEFEFENVCIGETVHFSETAEDKAGQSNIDTWTWDFEDNYILTNQYGDSGDGNVPEGTHGGNTSGRYKSPVHLYTEAKDYNVKLTVTTNKGCSNDTSFNVTVGSYPKVSLSAEGRILEKPVTLFNHSSNDVGEIDTCTWTLTNKTSGNELTLDANIKTNGTSYDPVEASLNEAGVYNLNLRAVSEIGCGTEKDTTIAVFPTFELSEQMHYASDFSDPERPAGWLIASEYMEDSKVKDGWSYAEKSGFEHSGAGDDNGFMWRTGNPADLNDDEFGWIETPCFDLSDISFPMISLDIFQSIEPGKDGTIIEYTVDDGETWERLGDIGSGANWYNQKGISTNPVSDNGINDGSKGWSADTNEWLTARYILDNVKQKADNSETGCARFRILYSSNDYHDSRYQGFGFDNFLIGKRKRIVLVEEFINAAFTASELQKDNHNTDLDALNEFVDSHKEEVCDIRYHIESRIYKDPLFDRINWQDNSARASEYGAFSWGPMWVMDGSAIKSRNNRGEPKRELTYGKALEERGLIDPSFDITDVTSELDGHSLKIKAKITPLGNVLDDPYKPEYVVRCAIVQEDYEGHRNVMIDLLPNGPGNTIKHIKADEATAGAPIDVEGSWLPAVRTIDNNFRFIIYVQGLGRYDVVEQVYFEDIDPDKVPQRAVPTGTKDILFADEWALYPNPVKDNISLTTPVGLDEEIIWTIHAINGLRIKQGSFYSNPSGPVEIPASELPEGLYILKLSRPDGTQISRKFTKVNR